MSWSLRREILQEFYEAAQLGLRPGTLRFDEALYLRIFNRDDIEEKSRTEQTAYKARLAKDPAALERRRAAKRASERARYERLHGRKRAFVERTKKEVMQ